MQTQIIDMPVIYETDAILKGKRKNNHYFVLDFIPFEVPVINSDSVSVAATIKPSNLPSVDYCIKDGEYITQYRGLGDSGIVSARHDLMTKDDILKVLHKGETIYTKNSNGTFVNVGLKSSNTLILQSDYDQAKIISDNRSNIISQMQERMKNACIVKKDGKEQLFIGTKGLELIIHSLGDKNENGYYEKHSVLKQDQDDHTFRMGKLNECIVFGLNGWRHRDKIIEGMKERGYIFNISSEKIHETEVFDGMLPDDVRMNIDRLLPRVFDRFSSILPYMSTDTLNAIVELSRARDAYRKDSTDDNVQHFIFHYLEEYTKSVMKDIPDNMAGLKHDMINFTYMVALASEHCKANRIDYTYDEAPKL